MPPRTALAARVVSFPGRVGFTRADAFDPASADRYDRTEPPAADGIAGIFGARQPRVRKVHAIGNSRTNLSIP